MNSGVVRKGKLSDIYIYINGRFLILTLFSLLFLSLLLLSSLLSSSTYAENINYSIEVAPVLNLTIPTSTINLNLNPNTKDFDSQDLSITVGTNNTWGYQLSMSSSTTSLVNAEDDTVTIETLPTLAGGYTTDTFEDNKWGYKKDGGNYFPYANTTLLESDTAAANDTTTLNFAAKVNYNQPAGNYTMSLSFNAVAKVAPPTMQNLDGSLCTITPTTAIDTRDGNLYTITRLPDGNCWMTKNLDLPGGTTLTPANSNVTTNYTLPESSTTGFSDNSTAYVYNSHSTTCADNSPCYSYYSYPAATAGTGASLTTGEATSDICPKGWRLPTQVEYETLISIYNTSALLTESPFLGVYGGYYTDSAPGDTGSSGYYWSSTTYNSARANRMYFYSASNGRNTYHSNKMNGLAVRCILPASNLSEITTMQQASTTIANNTANGATATLRDTRDNKQYTVAKIDGLIWMTKNLDLAGGTPLYSDTSNVPDGYPSTGGTAFYTLPASSASGFDDNAGAYVYNSNSTTCASGSPCYSYYSYIAAAAGTNPSVGDAEADVCPKGWRLPTSAEYTALISTYNTGALLTISPFLGVYSGYYDDTGFHNGGDSGFTWTSTAISLSDANHLYYGTSVIMTSDNKRYGLSVRCVMEGRTNLEKLQANSLTMQGIGNLSSSERSTLFSQMTAGTSYNTVDTRNGGTSYTIAKIGDQVWMTKNLIFGYDADNPSTKTITVSASDTNTNIDRTLTYYDLEKNGSSSAACYATQNDSAQTVSGGGISNACIHSGTDQDSQPVVYYNIVGASLGTIVNGDTAAVAYDVCPLGWRLPTLDEVNAVVSYATVLNPSFYGYWINGSLINSSTTGYWWTGTAQNVTRRYLMGYYSTSGLSATSGGRWGEGHGVRCIAK